MVSGHLSSTSTAAFPCVLLPGGHQLSLPFFVFSLPFSALNSAPFSTAASSGATVLKAGYLHLNSGRPKLWDKRFMLLIRLPPEPVRECATALLSQPFAAFPRCWLRSLTKPRLVAFAGTGRSEESRAGSRSGGSHVVVSERSSTFNRPFLAFSLPFGA